MRLFIVTFYGLYIVKIIDEKLQIIKLTQYTNTSIQFKYSFQKQILFHILNNFNSWNFRANKFTDQLYEIDVI